MCSHSLFSKTGRLSFHFQPPNRSFESYVWGSGKVFFDKVNQIQRRSLHQDETAPVCHNESVYLRAEVERLMTNSAKEFDLIGKQHLFSVYTHPSLGFRFPESSIFYGTEIPERIDTRRGWATFKIVVAEILLLKYALIADENQKFVLLSESCIPLYRPEVIYLQLMHETKSRLKACNAWDKDSMLTRWSDGMKTPYFTKANWRKSSQWFSLKRSHVEVIVNDVHVRSKFRTYCSNSVRHSCVADEHYIPTTLAVYGLGNETDCEGYVTAKWWTHYTDSHPVAFKSGNINSVLFKKLRNADVCMGKRALVSTQSIFSYEQKGTRCLSMKDTIVVKDKASMEGEDDWVVERGYHPMKYNCALFARKFTPGTVKETTRTALSCDGGGLGFWC